MKLRTKQGLKIISKTGTEARRKKTSQTLNDVMAYHGRVGRYQEMEQLYDNPKQIPLPLHFTSEADGHSTEVQAVVAKPTVILSSSAHARKQADYRRRAVAVSNALTRQGYSGLSVVELFRMASILEMCDDQRLKACSL